MKGTVIKVGGVTIDLSNAKVTGDSDTFIDFVGGPKPEIQGDGKIALEVTFPEGDYLSTEPVIPTLLNMAEATGEAVDLFIAEFIGGTGLS